MNRRAMVSAAGAACLCAAGALRAQEAPRAATRLRRVGVLSFGTAPGGGMPDPNAGIALGLRELGYVEGRDVIVEMRYAAGRPERLAALAQELVKLEVDVIVAGGPAPSLASRDATRTIPIVSLSGGDPVAEGWARSLSRPGGNVTGMTVTFPELGAKRLELLQQAVPGLVRVAVLWAPTDLRLVAYPDVIRKDALALGIDVKAYEITGPVDLEAAFDAMRRDRVQGVYALSTNTVVTYRDRLAALAVSARLPSTSDFSQLAEAGFMMSYGANLDAIAHAAAGYVDKILKGVPPGDIPIERPAQFDLVVNQKTARAIGVTLPQATLLRASRVIE